MVSPKQGPRLPSQRAVQQQNYPPLLIGEDLGAGVDPGYAREGRLLCSDVLCVKRETFNVSNCRKAVDVAWSPGYFPCAYHWQGW